MRREAVTTSWAEPAEHHPISPGLPSLALGVDRKYPPSQIFLKATTAAVAPSTANERLKIASRVLEAAVQAGLRPEDVIFDPLRCSRPTFFWDGTGARGAICEPIVPAVEAGHRMEDTR